MHGLFDHKGNRLRIHSSVFIAAADREVGEIVQILFDNAIHAASRRSIDLVAQIIPLLPQCEPESFILGGADPLTYTQVRRMCERIQRDTGFEENISPRRFRTTVLTDLYDMTKDIKQAQAAAGHTTATMTLRHYVKGRQQRTNTAAPIAAAYGLEN